MKCSLDISYFFEEISSLSHSIVFLYFFALITEESFLISPCYSLELCIQNGYIFPFLLCFLLVFFSQLFVRPPQAIIWPFCISFSWEWSWILSPVQSHEPPSIVHSALSLSDLVPCSNSNLATFLLSWHISSHLCIGNGTPLQYSCLENPMDGGAWWAAVHGVARSQIRLSDFTFTFHFHALEKEMATQSSVLAWRIPGTGEPGWLPSTGSHRVRHDWSDLAVAAAAQLCEEISY